MMWFARGLVLASLVARTTTTLSGLPERLPEHERDDIITNNGRGAIHYDASGNSTGNDAVVRRRLSMLPDWQAMETVTNGLDYTMVIKQNGDLYGTGNSQYGQLGIPKADCPRTGICHRTNFEKIASNAIAVQAGFRHTILIKAGGAAYGAGLNHQGGLGIGSRDHQWTFAPVHGMSSGVVSVACGFEHTVFLKQDGRAFATGDNRFGQLGDGTKVTRAIPVMVMSGVKAVGANGFMVASHHSVFVKQDGSAYAVGRNLNGQLGDGTTVDRGSLVQVMAGSNLRSVECGPYQTFFIAMNGSVYAAGRNTVGQLGDGTKVNKLTPVKVLTAVKAVSACEDHALFLMQNSDVYGVGSVALGLETTDGVTTPVKLKISGVTALSVTGHFFNAFSVFVTKDGKAHATGLNNYGSFGIGVKRTEDHLPLTEIMTDVMTTKPLWMTTTTVTTTTVLTTTNTTTTVVRRQPIALTGACARTRALWSALVVAVLLSAKPSIGF